MKIVTMHKIPPLKCENPGHKDGQPDAIVGFTFDDADGSEGAAIPMCGACASVVGTIAQALELHIHRCKSCETERPLSVMTGDVEFTS